MKKLISFMHSSLDGFVAGPNGEMDWINTDDAMFIYVEKRISAARVALYGRVTYQMMEAYWPTAAEQPGASRHDREHARWYNQVSKVVLSRTMQGADLPLTQVIGADLVAEINRLKREAGSDILMFGSPSALHALLAENLIDAFWLFVNPVLLGKGIPLFKNVNELTALHLLESKVFDSGVICLHYEKRSAVE